MQQVAYIMLSPGLAISDPSPFGYTHLADHGILLVVCFPLRIYSQWVFKCSEGTLWSCRFYFPVLFFYLYADGQELVCLFSPATPQRQFPQNSRVAELICVPFKRNQMLLCCPTCSEVIPKQALSNMLCWYLLTCMNRWAWGNVLDAVLGQSEEPGEAEGNVAGCHTMCCRLLLGYTVCKGKEEERPRLCVGLGLFLLKEF